MKARETYQADAVGEVWSACSDDCLDELCRYLSVDIGNWVSFCIDVLCPSCSAERNGGDAHGYGFGRGTAAEKSMTFATSDSRTYTVPENSLIKPKLPPTLGPVTARSGLPPSC